MLSSLPIEIFVLIVRSAVALCARISIEFIISRISSINYISFALAMDVAKTGQRATNMTTADVGGNRSEQRAQIESNLHLQHRDVPKLVDAREKRNSRGASLRSTNLKTKNKPL